MSCALLKVALGWFFLNQDASTNRNTTTHPELVFSNQDALGGKRENEKVVGK